MTSGYVYIAENSAFPGILKIGRAADVERRLHRTRTFCPTDWRCTYKIKVDSPVHVERLVHWGLARRRLYPKREFFTVGFTTAARTVLGAASHRSPSIIRKAPAPKRGQSLDKSTG